MPRETSDATYQTIAAAIRYVRANARRQSRNWAKSPPISGRALPSAAPFRRWAGISPKRFVQFLTRQHARNCSASPATC